MTNINKEKLREKIQITLEILKSNFSDRVEIDTLSPLSNMLSIHYYDLNNEFFNKKIEESIPRLREYIGNMIITFYEFGTVLTLFTIAISEVPVSPHKNSNNLSKEEIISHLLDIGEEIEPSEEFLLFLDRLLDRENIKEILTYISKNKKKASDILQKMIDSGKFQDKTQLHNELFSSLKELCKKNIIYHEIQNGVNIFATSIISASIAFGCITGAGILAPIVIIPATLLGIKLLSSQVDGIVSSSIRIFSSYADNSDKVVAQSIMHYNDKSHSKTKETLQARSSENISSNTLEKSNERVKQLAKDMTQGKLDEFKAKEYGHDVKDLAEQFKKNIVRKEL